MRAYRGELPDQEQVDLAVEVFRMLADATRLRLLWALLDGEAPVLRLAEPGRLARRGGRGWYKTLCPTCAAEMNFEFVGNDE